MADFILEYGHKLVWKSVFSTLGITVPPRLKRLKGAWKKQILASKKVHVELYKNSTYSC